MVEGTIEAVDVMVFIFVLGGMIGVINRTGSFNAGLMALARRTKGNEFMIVFSVSVLMVLGVPLVVSKKKRLHFTLFWSRYF